MRVPSEAGNVPTIMNETMYLVEVDKTSLTRTIIAIRSVG